MPYGKTSGKTEGSSLLRQETSPSDQFHTPVTIDSDEDVLFRIGHFGNRIEDTYSIYEQSVDPNLSPQERRGALDKIRENKMEYAWIENPSLRSDLRRYRVQSFDSLEAYNNGNDGAMAYYRAGEGITINRLSDEERAQLQEELREQALQGNMEIMTIENRFLIRDATSENFTYFHELNHQSDYENCHMQLLSQTPLNAAKAQRLTETKSYAVEYLAAAQQYVVMKEQGISTIMVNGQEQPIEMLLEQYAGLKEVVLEHGFDANDPESVRRVVAASAESWNAERKEIYASYMQDDFNVGLDYFCSQPISTQLELLKDQDAQYQEISANMLGDVYIGQNTRVDLSGCRDLLDTTTDEDIQQIPSKDYLMSYEELKAVNDYLEQKGITNDYEKMRYLSEHLKNLAYRLGEDKDPELTKLLLSQNNTVVCADGLAYSMGEDGRVVIDGKQRSAFSKKEDLAQVVDTNESADVSKVSMQLQKDISR